MRVVFLLRTIRASLKLLTRQNCRLILVNTIFAALILSTQQGFALSNEFTQGEFCLRALTKPAPQLFRVSTFNTKSLYFHDRAKKRSQTILNFKEARLKKKSKREVQKLAEVISSTEPDVAVFQEVKSVAELEHINKKYLQNQYQAVRLNGNDGMGFEIGFLIKRNIPLNFEIITHVEKRWVDEHTGEKWPLFTRDLPTIIFKKPGESKPHLILIGHHAKSKRGNDDENSREHRLRAAQHLEVARIIQQYQHKYGDEVPIILAGDFNTGIHESEDIRPILELMDDAFDLVEDPLQDDERATYAHFSHENPPEYNQLDGILITKTSLVKVERAGVRRDVRNLARNPDERDDQASDHFMVFADIELR